VGSEYGSWTVKLRYFEAHYGKKDRKFPSQVIDAADHNKPVTENSGIKFLTSLSDCSAIYIGILSAIYFGIKMC
jgi:hypothetical protein